MRAHNPFSHSIALRGVHVTALALSDDDAVLVAGNGGLPFIVSGYGTTSRTRLWIRDTQCTVGAVCMLGAHVLVTLCTVSVQSSPMLVLDLNTGAHWR